MYFYIKIIGLVVFGPKSYCFRGLWPKNLKKVKKNSISSWKQNISVLVQKLTIVIISLTHLYLKALKQMTSHLYRLVKNLRRCRMKDCFVPVKKKSTTKIFVVLCSSFFILCFTHCALRTEG